MADKLETIETKGWNKCEEAEMEQEDEQDLGPEPSGATNSSKASN